MPLEPTKASQAKYVRFKKNIISRIQEIIWMDVFEVTAGDNEIFVLVNCGQGFLCTLYYEFDSDFQLKYVTPGADFRRQYKSLLEEGKVTMELEEFLKKCEEDVLFWDGDDWISPPIK